MAIRLRLGGTLREIKSIRMRIGGQLRTIKSVRVRIDGQLRTVFTAGGGGAFSLAITPSFVSGTSQSDTVFSQVATASPTGGVSPYSYAWTVTSYTNPVSPQPESPTFASTRFRQSGISPGSEATGQFRCTCTDSVGQVATADCEAFFTRRDLSGEPL